MYILIYQSMYFTYLSHMFFHMVPKTDPLSIIHACVLFQKWLSSTQLNGTSSAFVTVNIPQAFEPIGLRHVDIGKRQEKIERCMIQSLVRL